MLQIRTCSFAGNIKNRFHQYHLELYMIRKKSAPVMNWAVTKLSFLSLRSPEVGWYLRGSSYSCRIDIREVRSGEYL